MKLEIACRFGRGRDQRFPRIWRVSSVASIQSVCQVHSLSSLYTAYCHVLLFTWFLQKKIWSWEFGCKFGKWYEENSWRNREGKLIGEEANKGGINEQWPLLASGVGWGWGMLSRICLRTILWSTRSPVCSSINSYPSWITFIEGGSLGG